MADIVQESLKDGSRYDIQLRHTWKIGEKYLLHSKPSVEGMVAGTKWVNEVLMILFMSPPFTKVDGAWEKATLSLQTATSCTKQKLLHYEFPFPADPRLKLEIQKANGNHEALQEVIAFLNQRPVLLPSTPPPLLSSSVLDTVKPSSPVSPNKTASSSSAVLTDGNGLNVSAASGNPPASSSLPSNLLDDAVLAQLAEELSRRLTFTQPVSAVQSSPSLSPTLSAQQIKTSLPKRSLSSSSSSSSSRSSASSRASSRVRKRKHSHSSGCYTCPFSANDIRHSFNPYKRFQTKSEERKYLRRALHDLYSEYSTLRSFVDSVRTHLFSTPTRPYTSDLVWLQQHADYLDCLNLYMISGAWSAWNDLVLDKITRAFLELLVRVSPNRAYPDILDESVRKWMRKKRVGICSQFGPVPSFLVDAKVSESGIQPKTGWDNNWRLKDSRDGRQREGSSFAPGKLKPGFSAAGERK